MKKLIVFLFLILVSVPNHVQAKTKHFKGTATKVGADGKPKESLAYVVLTLSLKKDRISQWVFEPDPLKKDTLQYRLLERVRLPNGSWKEFDPSKALIPTSVQLKGDDIVSMSTKATKPDGTKLSFSTTIPSPNRFLVDGSITNSKGATLFRYSLNAKLITPGEYALATKNMKLKQIK